MPSDRPPLLLLLLRHPARVWQPDRIKLMQNRFCMVNSNASVQNRTAVADLQTPEKVEVHELEAFGDAVTIISYGVMSPTE